MAGKKENRSVKKVISESIIHGNVIKWYLNKYLLISAILLFAAAIFAPSVTNDFINYDDSDFILKNAYIRNLSWEGIKNIFLALDKHDPITVLTHAVTFKFWNLNPVPYHLLNLIFHLINIVLVFILFFKILQNRFSAGIMALLFAVHPLKVESVCWISERKDVLYALFFLLSLISYIYYISKNNKLIFLILSLLFFLFSLLSKFSAVTLPFILILIDYFYSRKINLRSLMEKCPFLLFSLFLLFYHFFFIEKSNKVVDFNIYSLYDRLFFCSYSLLYYLREIIFFGNYSAIHPYPPKTNGLLPIEYYFSMILMLVIMIIAYFLVKRASKHLRPVLFGILFFLVNISLVLHIVPVHGVVIVADRYTYLAFLGLFFIPAYFISCPLQNRLRIITIVVLAVYLIVCSFRTVNRIKTWKNGLSFWNNVIEQNPAYFYGYFGKGVAIYNMWDYAKSKLEFDKSIKYNKGYELSYFYRARCESKLNEFSDAVKDYNSALEINSCNADSYFERANTLFRMNKPYEAIIDFNTAIKIDSSISSFYNNRGFVYMQMRKYKEALSDYNKAIELNPLYAEALNNRANLKILIKDYHGAILDLDYTISLEPKIIALYISGARTNLYVNDTKSAINDCLKGLAIDPGNSTLYLLIGIAELQSDNSMDACKQLSKASSLGNFQADSLMKKYCIKNQQ